jgi:hypothetical protein
MRTSLCLAVAAAALTVAAAYSKEDYGYMHTETDDASCELYAKTFAYEPTYEKYNKREKTEKYMKCAGAEGYPHVQYVACVEGYMCGEYAAIGWGKYCIPQDQHYGSMCYNENQRCMGEEGHEYVPYHDCCGTDMWCCKDENLGWGYFCKKKAVAAPKEHPTYDKPVYEYVPEHYVPEYYTPKVYEPVFKPEHYENYDSNKGHGYGKVAKCIDTGYTCANDSDCCYAHDSCVKETGHGKSYSTCKATMPMESPALGW